MADFVKADWRIQHKRTRTSRYKRAIYRVARPVLQLHARMHLSPSTLGRLKPGHVLFERGMPIEHRRAWAAGPLNIKDCRLLVQGTGTGWDVISWATLRPRSIIATDLFAFPETWEPIARYCRDHFGVVVEFRAAPLEDHSFLAAGSIDLCASDAVFEHCRDLPAVLAETKRILKIGGRVYASYGPLWWSPGGDHFSGRGGLSEIFNHLLLEPSEYRAYFEHHLLPSEDFQSGGRYVDLDLFSRLTSSGYLDAFLGSGFAIEDSWFILSSRAREFRRLHRPAWDRLVSRLPRGVSEDELLIGGHLVRLRHAPATKGRP